MQFGLAWLGDYLSEVPDADFLERELPLAGFEVESRTSVAGEFDGVVVVSVVEVKQHPNADRLRVCRVDDGEQQYNIVCGASNVQAGMKAALSRVGAVLPGNVHIKCSTIRGELSEGMLCSELELGISQEHDGIIALPSSAQPGADVRSVLALDEQVIDVDITPNRGDCLSVRGLGREIAAMAGVQFSDRCIVPVKSGGLSESKEIILEAKDACPRYAGRVIRLGQKGVSSPHWMQQRLIRAGLRPIHLVVDVTNFVMLDLGQPLHAFDYNKLLGNVRVRWGQSGEVLVLLNGQQIDLDDNILVIADNSGPVALAGIMGGATTEIDDQSEYVFLEAAYFAARAVAGRARNLGLHTDASMRFERGVDWQLPPVAIEMATQLLVEYGGAEVGSVSDVCESQYLPQRQKIECSIEKFSRLAGVEIDPVSACRQLRSLGMQVESRNGNNFVVTTPCWRYDLERSEDVFEEVLRLYGYSEVPETLPQYTRPTDFSSGACLDQFRLFDHLVGMGYQEVISYSFIDPISQMEFIGDEEQTIILENPISADLAHMRSSLMPSLLGVIASNIRRQYKNLCIFESGLCFRAINGVVEQKPVLAMAVCGNSHTDYWHDESRMLDLYHLKGHVESMLALSRSRDEIHFVPHQVKGLHPGQSAKVLIGENKLGVLGKVHPRTVQNLGFDRLDVFVAELDFSMLLDYVKPRYRTISVYPPVYRDLAVTVDQQVQWQQIRDCVYGAADDTLVAVTLFDLYQRDSLGTNKKSVAFKLCWQSTEETLTDSCIDKQIGVILEKLDLELQAQLRV